jgi:hypothetical protein
VGRFIVPPRSGKAWTVAAGQVCRIVTVEGAQVAHFNAWNRHLSVQMWGPARDNPLPTCRPLGVEISQPPARLLAGWKPASPINDQGIHRLRGP